MLGHDNYLFPVVVVMMMMVLVDVAGRFLLNAVNNIGKFIIIARKFRSTLMFKNSYLKGNPARVE